MRLCGPPLMQACDPSLAMAVQTLQALLATLLHCSLLSTVQAPSHPVPALAAMEEAAGAGEGRISGIQLAFLHFVLGLGPHIALMAGLISLPAAPESLGSLKHMRSLQRAGSYNSQHGSLWDAGLAAQLGSASHRKAGSAAGSDTGMNGALTGSNRHDLQTSAEIMKARCSESVMVQTEYDSHLLELLSAVYFEPQQAASGGESSGNEKPMVGV